MLGIRYSATEVNDIVAGRWRRLWGVKSGRDEPEDLSRNFKVQLGRWTEEFNLRWLVASRDVVVEPLREGLASLPEDAELRVHPSGGPWARRGRYSARPDGLGRDGGGLFVVEAKHVADREAPERIVRSYLGQLFVTMHVFGACRAVLSVIFGADRLTTYGVTWSETTWKAVEDLVEAFDGHLLLDIAPVDPTDPPYLALPLPELTNRWRPQRAEQVRAAPC
ncbi:MAG TPA: hypothetical protein VFG43_05665 [Geminicoccaceae bacterium]|nr:hypothetical protein [Geminicoccaceae bacterium]